MQYRTRPQHPLRFPAHRSHRRLLIPTLIVIVVLILGTAFAIGYHHGNHALAQTRKASNKVAITAKSTTPSATAPVPAAKAAPKVASGPCAGNQLSKLALVSIGQRRLWACKGAAVAYTSAVVTGMEKLPADLTPVGTYHVYGKETNLYLNGSDSTGSWHDYVYYWMPFLDNQYGAYGFHDATWRPADAFGNISPDSSNASHGCVELPLATAKWLYDWVSIGTTVTIES